ncbi:hypothetical protein MKW92_015558, partial [Papaver armeniacum]
MEFEPLNNMDMEFDIGSGEENDDLDINNNGIDVEQDVDYDNGEFLMVEIYLGILYLVLLIWMLILNRTRAWNLNQKKLLVFFTILMRVVSDSVPRVSTYHRSRHDDAIICRQIVCSRQGFHQGRDRNRSARSLIDTLQAAGIGPSGVMSVLIKESGGVDNVGFSTVDYRNYLTSRQRHFGGGAQQ